MRIALLAAVLIAAGCDRSPDAGSGGLPDSGAEGGPAIAVDASVDAASPFTGQLPRFEAGLPISDSGPAASDTGAGPVTHGGLPMPCSSGACTAEQNQLYADCVIDRCDEQYRACLGPGYRSGVWSGPCQAYLTCTVNCGCNDIACKSACPLPTAECQSCLGNVGTCVLGSNCTPPVCGSSGALDAGGAGGAGGGGGGGGTCNELMKCCNAITSADQKTQCNQFYMSIMQGGDAACGGVLMIYRANKLCP